VVDSADGELVDAVEAEGMRCLVTPTVMTDVDVATDLCRTLLSLDRPVGSPAGRPR
jgi:hypothetical protein